MSVEFNSFYESFEASRTATVEDVAYALTCIAKVLKHKEVKDIFHTTEQRSAVDRLCNKVETVSKDYLSYKAQEGFDASTIYNDKKNSQSKKLKSVYEALAVFVPILEQRNLKSDLLNAIKFNTEQLIEFM